jgi:transcriptional regulator with XRE-family HTH domain
MNSELIGKQLKSLREEKNLTAVDVEKATGITSMTIGRYENGTTNPKLENLAKLAEFYRYPLSKLIELGELNTMTENYLLSLDKEVFMELTNNLIGKIGVASMSAENELQEKFLLDLTIDLRKIVNQTIGVKTHSELERLKGAKAYIEMVLFPRMQKFEME